MNKKIYKQHESMCILFRCNFKQFKKIKRWWQKISIFLIALFFVLPGCGNDKSQDSPKKHSVVVVKTDAYVELKSESTEPKEPIAKTPAMAYEPSFQNELKNVNVAPQGRLCVAALDFSTTPGKGSSGPFKQYPVLHKPDPKAQVKVTVNGVDKFISHKDGAFFENLALDKNHKVALSKEGRRPFFRHTFSLKNADTFSLCLYNNAFYDTWQISDKPRRVFCKKCMNPKP